MVKSLDISFSLKQRLQEDGGAVEVELEVPRKVSKKIERSDLILFLCSNTWATILNSL